MTFRQKLADSIAEKLLWSDRGAWKITVAVVRLKKDAVNLLRELRDEGELYSDVVRSASQIAAREDGSMNTVRRLTNRLSNAHVSISDQKVSLHEGEVFIIPEKDLETAMNIFAQANRQVFEVIADETCSDNVKFVVGEPREEAVEDILSWIDSIPVM